MLPAKTIYGYVRGLNESPSEKEGKFFRAALFLASPNASMKVPPKRKGNLIPSSCVSPPSEPQ